MLINFSANRSTNPKWRHNRLTRDIVWQGSFSARRWERKVLKIRWAGTRRKAREIQLRYRPKAKIFGREAFFTVRKGMQWRFCFVSSLNPLSSAESLVSCFNKNTLRISNCQFVARLASFLLSTNTSNQGQGTAVDHFRGILINFGENFPEKFLAWSRTFVHVRTIPCTPVRCTRSKLPDKSAGDSFCKVLKQFSLVFIRILWEILGFKFEVFLTPSSIYSCYVRRSTFARDTEFILQCEGIFEQKDKFSL